MRKLVISHGRVITKLNLKHTSEYVKEVISKGESFKQFLEEWLPTCRGRVSGTDEVRVSGTWEKTDKKLGLNLGWKW